MVQEHIDNGNKIGSIFLDLWKAFDVVDHEVLLQKFRLYQFSEQSLKWFTLYLSSRKQKDLCK